MSRSLPSTPSQRKRSGRLPAEWSPISLRPAGESDDSSRIRTTPPRSDSLSNRHLPPRTVKESSPITRSRSPRLGQESFDRETEFRRRLSSSPTLSRTGALTDDNSPRVPVARQLFHDNSSSVGLGLDLNESDAAVYAADEGLDRPWNGGIHSASNRLPAGAEWEQSAELPPPRLKPAALDLSSSPRAIPGVRPSSAASSTLNSELKTAEKPSSTEKPDEPTPKTTIKPSIGLLFSLTAPVDRVAIVLPAVIFSILAGLVPPYMTIVIGQAFSAYSNYALASIANPPLTAAQMASARQTLLDHSLISAITFIGMGVGIFVFQAFGTWLWALHGERVARALRREVFEGVGRREMAWFDTGMGVEETEEEEGEKPKVGDEESGAGSGGLLGRFTKETDDARMATAAPCGLVIQYLTSFFVALGISFYRSYLLTFVVLASFPVVAFIVTATEGRASILVVRDREYSTKSASRLDRILGAIPTVKAFNAEKREVESFSQLTKVAFDVYCSLHFIWGVRGGIVKFIILSMFVQGFWFGWWLVKTNRSSAEAVNTCFWACLTAMSYVQSTVPLLVTLEKGKIAMAGQLDLARRAPEPVQVMVMASSVRNSRDRKGESLIGKLGIRGGRRRQKSLEGSEPLNEGKPAESLTHELGGPLSPHPFTTVVNTPTTGLPILIPLAGHSLKSGPGRTAPRALRKLRPSTFTGELSLRDITFHYPSRPHPAPPVLRDVNLYLAACETTFIVGGSGSGKSTISSLLLGLYAPEAGRVEVDEQGLEWIDETWLRSHVACVSQGAAIIFEGTVHENVAMGVVGQVREDGSHRQISEVTREEVVAACRGALLHEFIRDLPDGYDTWLSGEKGAALSGGQRQRLAIARAWIRDPTVLVLDEATSALDATSRLLVSEAVKRWRQNRTTVIITHDLSPIDPQDFVYVMADGQVVEQGYREDLESTEGGSFTELALHQRQFGVEAEEFGTQSEEDEALETLANEFAEPETAHSTPRMGVSESLLFRIPGAGSVVSNGFHDVARASRELRDARRASAEFEHGQIERLSVNATPPRRPSSRRSFSGSSRSADSPELGRSGRLSRASGRDSSLSFSALELVGQAATMRRSTMQRIKHKSYTGTLEVRNVDWRAENDEDENADQLRIDVVTEEEDHSNKVRRETMSLTQIAKRFYPSIPNKPMFYFGLFLSMLVGVGTPVFSYLLAKLIANLANKNAGKTITTTSLLVLLVALIEGVTDFAKFYMLERCAMAWVAALRRRALELVVRQDKSFFDRAENTTGALVHSIVKDAEDARLLIGTVIGQVVVVVTMLLLGIVWAFAVGWELTLVGVAFAPFFIIGTRGLQVLHSRQEGTNKVRREGVSRKFQLNISNIRAIRSMALESVVRTKFELALQEAYAGGSRAAPLAGLGNGFSVGLTFLAEAAMVYVGAVLIAKGRYTFETMTTVFALIIFSITFAAQIAVYLPGLTKSQEAITDFSRLLSLGTETSESEGTIVFPVKGNLTFEAVSFSYPSRPDVPILRETSFTIAANECVGIVGASGSGKSTVTALLQRLYEPSSGRILLDGRPLSRIDTKFLRNHVAVVSQHPALFDFSVADNISYGSDLKLPPEQLRAKVEKAAKLAHVHEFIISLPKGYETRLGENASLISGGQLQRLQLARALMHEREILLLDECTSALDATNQALVMNTIEEVKKGRTTIMVTHKLDVMKRCDWLIVMDQGRVVETGTVDDLRSRGGFFAQLASGGEWEAS